MCYCEGETLTGINRFALDSRPKSFKDSQNLKKHVLDKKLPFHTELTFSHCHRISVQLLRVGSWQFGLLAPSGNSSSLLCRKRKKKRDKLNQLCSNLKEEVTWVQLHRRLKRRPPSLCIHAHAATSEKPEPPQYACREAELSLGPSEV